MKNKIKLLRMGAIWIGLLAYSFTTKSKLAPHITTNVIQYYAEFRVKKVISYEGSNSQSTFFIAFANAYQDTVSSTQPWSSVNAGTVLFNNIPLKYEESIQSYADTTVRSTIGGVNWKFNNQIDIDFNLTFSDTFPSLTNLENLPNELIKSNNLTIDLSGYSYADEIEIDFYDGIMRLQRPFYRRTEARPSSITIPSSDLSVFSSTGLHITIGLIKHEYRVVNGKKFRFEKRLDVVKYLPIYE